MTSYYAKTSLPLLLICCICNSICAQQTEIINYLTVKPKVPVDKTSWCVVEEAASFPGGIAIWTKYLADSTNYPTILPGNRRIAIVSISFIVSKDGWVTEVQNVDSVEDSFTQEALRVVRNSPRWNPAKRNGRLIS